jgi:hypothetical protein
MHLIRSSHTKLGSAQHGYAIFQQMCFLELQQLHTLSNDANKLCAMLAMTGLALFR